MKKVFDIITDMTFDIDQSGKIEQTSWPTIIAVANKTKSFTILLHQREKKKLLNHYRDLKQPKAFLIETFSILLYVLIDHFSLQDDILRIDLEYEGNEKYIQKCLVQLGLNANCIRFEKIGTSSAAHVAAINAFRKHKADMEVKANEILKLANTIKKDQVFK